MVIQWKKENGKFYFSTKSCFLFIIYVAKIRTLVILSAENTYICLPVIFGLKLLVFSLLYDVPKNFCFFLK